MKFTDIAQDVMGEVCLMMHPRDVVALATTCRHAFNTVKTRYKILQQLQRVTPHLAGRATNMLVQSAQDIVPLALETLILHPLYSDRLCMQLPLLTTLGMCSVRNQSLGCLSNAPRLTHLKILGWYNQPLCIQIAHLKTLMLGNSYNHKISLCQLPCLQELVMGNAFNKHMEWSSRSLTSLRLGNAFNQHITLAGMPALQHLAVGNAFNQPVPLESTQLKTLSLGGVFNQRIEAFALPQLTKLTLSDRYNHSMQHIVLPHLTTLTLGICFNQPMSALQMPALTSLTLGECFNHDISTLVLPHLTSLTLGRFFQHSVVTGFSQLETLALNADEPLGTLECYPRLQTLRLGNLYNQPVEQLVLPCLQQLVLGVYFTHTIEQLQLPMLRVLRMCSVSRPVGALQGLPRLETLEVCEERVRWGLF